MKIKSGKLVQTCLSVLALSLVSTFAYAEHTAPVYDVDSMSNDSQATAAGTPSDDNIKSALNQALTSSSEPPATVDQRVERIEQQLSNMQQSDLSNRLNSMQGEVQSLRGQVEELTHQLQDLRQQREQHAAADPVQNKDLADQQAVSPVPRVGDDEAGSTPKAAHAKNLAKSGAQGLAKQTAVKQASAEHASKKTIAPVEQPNLAEEQAVYQTAYNLIKVKKYNEAIASLQKMLGKYPSGQFAANAHYWLGELYSLTGENERAAGEFGIVVKQYPSNPRVADAELKLGLINATLLKWPAATASFKKVLSKYPGSTSARLAMEQLKLLKQSGH
jgi:tol-pal system protein YbgF